MTNTTQVPTDALRRIAAVVMTVKEHDRLSNLDAPTMPQLVKSSIAMIKAYKALTPADIELCESILKGQNDG